MKPIPNALIWASVIILFALIAVSGPIESETAKYMMIMLPVLAWTTLGNSTAKSEGCKPCRLFAKGDAS